MKPVMQTKFTDPEQTVHGNCQAACVASLLDLPLSAVPAFEDMGDEWFGVLYEFLRKHGYDYAGTKYTGPSHNQFWWEFLLESSPGIDGYFIVGGKSPRAWVTRGHAVIYKDGVLVHDPHPSGAGLLVVEDVMMIERR
jgi:hypothetical protein